jgi:acetamidase/formamidase
MPKTHYFPEDWVHYVWDNEQEPALTVEPGDTVVYRTREVSDGQIVAIRNVLNPDKLTRV